MAPNTSKRLSLRGPVPQQEPSARNPGTTQLTQPSQHVEPAHNVQQPLHDGIMSAAIGGSTTSQCVTAGHANTAPRPATPIATFHQPPQTTSRRPQKTRRSIAPTSIVHAVVGRCRAGGRSALKPTRQQQRLTQTQRQSLARLGIVSPQHNTRQPQQVWSGAMRARPGRAKSHHNTVVSQHCWQPVCSTPPHALHALCPGSAMHGCPGCMHRQTTQPAQSTNWRGVTAVPSP